MSMQLQGTLLRTRSSLLTVTGTSPSIELYSAIVGIPRGPVGSSNTSSGSVNGRRIHTSAILSQPATKSLPLPVNVEEINATEKVQFSPQRNRDISGPVILSKFHGTFSNGFIKRYNKLSQPVDPHIASYDCTGPVSMSSVMQTNVPTPYSSKGKTTHLNMPGGQWGQGYKYISEDLQNTHYRSIRQGKEERNTNKSGTIAVPSSFGSRKFFHTSSSSEPYSSACLKNLLSTSDKNTQLQTHMLYSTSVDSNSGLTRKEKLKRAVKEYGSTVIVFHVGISLISLGGFYLAVSSGLDVKSILDYFGAGGNEVTAGASTFVLAYAIHKVFAPVRISITLASTPFIVRYLRRVGFLKVPKPSSSTS